MHTNPVTWFEIYVEDMNRARKFYEAVFDCTLIPEENGHDLEIFQFPGSMPGNGAMGALIKHPMRPPSNEGTIIYFHCENSAASASLVCEHGGQIFRERMKVGDDGFIVIVGDTEGNAFGLHSFN